MELPLTPDGPEATIVTEIYDCSRVPEKERAGMDNGKIWLAGELRAVAAVRRSR